MRRAALLVCVMISALVVATGVALAAAETQTEGTEGTEGTEVPLQGDESTVDFVPNEVVVRTDEGVYETRKVDAQTLDAVEKAGERIEAREPSVEETSPNFVYTIAAFTPDDPNFNQQYWLHGIKARGAWDDSQGAVGSGGVPIGLVDTGWQETHPDLNNKANGAWDFVNDRPAQVGEAEGNDWHGTAVAGVAAAETNNKQGVASIGFKSRFFMAEACSDFCFTEDTAPAIDWLAQQKNVKIINLSFGAIYQPGTTDQLLGDAIQRAQRAGALVVAAAGNEGVDTDNHYPSCFEGVIGVGAVNAAGTKADFSNYGPCVDLVAPGENVLTTITDEYATPEYGGPYNIVWGTSFSAPQVAGTAALIRARNPDLSAKEIADRLQSYATDLGEPGRDPSYGYGLLNARCSVGPGARSCPP